MIEQCTLDKPCYYCCQEQGGAISGMGYAGPPCINEQLPPTQLQIWGSYLFGVLFLIEIALVFAWAVNNS